MGHIRQFRKGIIRTGPLLKCSAGSCNLFLGSIAMMNFISPFEIGLARWLKVFYL